MPTADIIDGIARRLAEAGYKINRDVTLPQGPAASLTASRTYFSWKGLVVLSQHIVVRPLDNATTADAQQLFDAGFRYGKLVNRVPLLRGLQFGYMVIPVIVGADPDAALIQYVSAAPRKHWSLFEYPVFVDSRTGQTVYFKGTPLWGAFFYSDMRQVVEKFISFGANAAAR